MTFSHIYIKYFDHIHHLLPSLYPTSILIVPLVWVVVLFRGSYIFNVYFIFNYVSEGYVHMSTDALSSQRCRIHLQTFTCFIVHLFRVF